MKLPLNTCISKMIQIICRHSIRNDKHHIFYQILMYDKHHIVMPTSDTKFSCQPVIPNTYKGTRPQSIIEDTCRNMSKTQIHNPCPNTHYITNTKYTCPTQILHHKILHVQNTTISKHIKYYNTKYHTKYLSQDNSLK